MKKTIQIEASKYEKFAGRAAFHTAGSEFEGLKIGDIVTFVEVREGTKTGDAMTRSVTDTSEGPEPIVGFTK